MSQTIDLTIPLDYLHPFASPERPRLCPELANYLSERAWYHPDLELQISCPPAERERLQQAIATTFTEKSEQIRGDMRLLRLVGIALTVLAVALVLAATALGVEGTIPMGMVTIIAWMLVWRTAEIFLLDINKGRRKLRKYQRIINAPKHFV